MPSSPAVSATALSRTYGYGARAVPAVRDVDLVVGAGVLTAVLGPAGAGKSTLLACLAGTDRAVTGRVVQHSVRLPPGRGGQRTRLRPARIGVVSPPACLDPAPTVARIVQRCDDGDLGGLDDPGGAALGRSWWHVVVATLGLRDHLAARVGDLGPAERQRVALARALAGRPDVLLVDEPAAGGGPGAVADAAACLRACAHRLGLAVVVATRDPALACRADRTVVLREGRLVHDSAAPLLVRRSVGPVPGRPARPVLLQDDRAR